MLCGNSLKGQVQSLIVCPSKYQEITNIWSVSEWLCAYMSIRSLKLVVRQTQSDHILVNHSIAPGLY